MMQKLCQWLMRLLGWRITGALPNLPQYLVIVAPHTSNWDLVIGLIARFAVGVKIHFIAKKEVFFFPLGQILRAVGGTPVDRGARKHVVDQMVEKYKKNPNFIFGLAPEGTRSPVKRWKYGFYHIAHQANVPIVMIGFDYAKKEIQIQKPFDTTGQIDQDFAQMMTYFRTVRGRHAKDIPDFISEDGRSDRN